VGVQEGFLWLDRRSGDLHAGLQIGVEIAPVVDRIVASLN